MRDISNAKVTGAEIGSTEVHFYPGSIVGGIFKSAVRTAGSISLLLQVALPCTLFANAGSTLILQGGTNAEMAPQIDYTTEVLRPILSKFGVGFDFNLIRRGYYPKGGGEVEVCVKPVKQLNSVEMLSQGYASSVYGWSFVAGTLPLHIAHRMADSVIKRFQTHDQRCSMLKVEIERYKESAEVATGNCSGIM